MGLSLSDVDGGLLIVSQFTLLGDVRRGNRPSFSSAQDIETAQRHYRQFVAEACKRGVRVATGRFRADMTVHVENDGGHDPRGLATVVLSVLAPPGLLARETLRTRGYSALGACETHRKCNCLVHPPRIGLPRTGDVVACAVVDRGPNDRQTKRHVHGLTEPEELARYRRLVVVHRDYAVVHAARREADGSLAAKRARDLGSNSFVRQAALGQRRLPG